MHTVRHVLGTLALILPILSHAAGDGRCTYAPAGKLALEFRKGPPLPSVTGSINGVPARMRVDTGRYQTVLMRAGAERLKLALTASGKYTYGAGGASVTYLAQVDDFSMGDIHTGRSLVPVSGNSALNDRTPEAERVDATIGADYLLQADMELSIAARTMQFYRLSGCADAFLAYWDRDALVVPFVGLLGKTNVPMVEVELNGVKMTAVFDTGANHTLVRRRAAASAGVSVGAPGVTENGHVAGTGDKVLQSWVADFRSFRLGDETVNNPRLRIVDDSPQGQSQVDVLLGLDFMRAHHILFAMSQDRLYLSYLGGELFGAQQQAQAPAKAP